MNLFRRKSNLKLVCEGTNTEYLRENIDTDLLLALSEHQSTRVKRALNAEFSIFPIASSIYSVISVDESQETNLYKTNTKVQSCTCSDFLYHCDYENGERCKHLWRIQFLQKINALPDNNQDPKVWLLNQIEKDKIDFKEDGNDIAAKRLEEVQYKLIQYNPLRQKDYRTPFIHWLDILRTYLN